MAGLTDLSVSKAKANASRREIPDGESGLFLIVQPSGVKSWAIRYRFKGVPRKYTLGQYPGLGLKQARTEARKAQGKIAGGGDPGATKKAEKVAFKLAAVAKEAGDKDQLESVIDEFVKRHAKKKTRESSWKETERILKTEIAGPARKGKRLPAWNGKRLADISLRDVHDLLDSIVDRDAPILANRTLAALRRMCSWAVERGILVKSPCEGVKAPAAERSRDRVLSDDELKLIWAACDSIGWPFGPLVQLLILTAQRRDEVGAMTWAEVDLAGESWTLPKERSKNGVEHVIPLSAAAIAILENLPRIKHHNKDSQLVFTTNGKTPVAGFSKIKERIDGLVLKALRKAAEDAEPPPRWTLHDLRRTATSGMARLGVAPHVADAVLNHKSGAIRGVAAVYNRYSYASEKVAALATWGRFVEALTSGKSATNVVELVKVGD